MTAPSDPLTATPTTQERHVFLSYSSKDRDLALELKQALEARGINVWIDVDRMRSGSLIVTELKEYPLTYILNVWFPELGDGTV